MPNSFTNADAGFMRTALGLARNGEGRVSPNPPVGCVLVKNGEIVGRGWHDRLGGLHAEAMAIRDAGDAAAGSAAYVTLSPCSTTGRQPPCADALAAAKVAEVIIAAVDPNPDNASGPDRLRELGLAVRSGLLREQAEYLARGFFKRMRYGLPYVAIKYAMTLDGKIATTSGDSRWVSGEESRVLVHDMRSRADAVLIGSGTALADNPLLTVREPALSRRGEPGSHPQPWRVIADSLCGVSPGMAMFNPENGPVEKIIVACTDRASSARVEAVEKTGANVVRFASEPGGGKVPMPDLMRHLADAGIALVLCEGGAEISAALLRNGLADEVVAFVAPKLAGGHGAQGPVGELGVRKMSAAPTLRTRECKFVGDDIFIRADVLRE